MTSSGLYSSMELNKKFAKVSKYLLTHSNFFSSPLYSSSSSSSNKETNKLTNRARDIYLDGQP